MAIHAQVAQLFCVALGIAVSSLSCYNPSFADGRPCGPGRQCPDGQTCGLDPNTAMDLCFAEGQLPNTADAAMADGRSDGRLVDATTGDARSKDAACSWNYAPTLFDPCDPAFPATQVVLPLTQAGTYTYDTDTATMTAPNAAMSSPPHLLIGDAQVLWLQGFSVASGSTLRVVGSRPLLIVSAGDIIIDGALDGSSFRNGGVFAIGAGANASGCPTSSPQPGQICVQHGGSGGGGGAFGGHGGMGGEGGDARDCGGGFPDGIPGGAGGVALAAPPSGLRGGCAGRDGAPNSSFSPDFGLGGPGGGAVQLSAAGNIFISGAIQLGGAGGGGALENRAGGGGGGSGGFIRMEAISITISATGILAANGGGGGGGTGTLTATDGEAGHLSAQVAEGGTPGQAGSGGGDGGTGIVMAQSAQVAERGGGGGGGGAGFIVLRFSEQMTISPSAIISPSPN